MKYLLIVAALAVALGLVLFGCTEEPELLQAPTPTSGILKSAMDGTETLGDLSIPIARGTGVVAAGEGLLNASPPGTGTIEVAVPNAVPTTVEQVLLYWEGHDTDPGADMGPTDVITVGGSSVTGTRIGGPTLFYSNYSSATYRADITLEGLVNPGSNSISVSGMDFDKNNGIGVVVIYTESNQPISDILMKDGNDLAWIGFEPGQTGHCEKQTFTFDSATFERDALISLSASSVENPRPNTLYLWIGGTPYSTFPILSPFSDADEAEWDTYHLAIKIPAGVTTVEMLPVSEDHGTGMNPASIAWLNATVAIQSRFAEIGNRVWIDGDCSEANGCQDPGELGVPGVTVELYRCNPPGAPTLHGTEVTDADGIYWFVDLDPGDYAVKFILPAGHEFVTQNNCGSIPNDTDSDPDDTGWTICTNLEAGEIDPTWDAGLCTPTATIGDKVWCDEDCDGCQDDGEPGIAGVTVNLYRGCLSSTVYLTMTTDANGEYLFEDIPADDYVVQFTNLPAHYEFTTQNACALGDEKDSDADPVTGKTACVTLNAGDDDRSWDAGLVPLTAVGDYVWHDENRDGCQDTEEDGVAGVTVYLFECGDPTPIDDTTTDSNGWYQFDDLSPCKEYRLQFVKPSADLEFSPKDACGDDEKDSDADPTSGFTDCFVPSADCEVYDVDGSWDAGFSEPPTGCRMTGGAENTSENIALGGDPGLDTYSGSGQAGAPTALPPQPWGEWTHTQKRGASGAFTFHAGTASAPPGTEIDWIECTDPGWCRQARHAPAKQIDFAGVGTFKNMKPSVPASIADHVTVGESMHWFEVNIDDLGEPGKAGKIKPPADSCPELGFGRNGGAGTGVCDCPDFYRIKIYEGPDDSYPVMYEVYGYIDHGNYQIHPLTGRDRKNISSGGGRGR